MSTVSSFPLLLRRGMRRGVLTLWRERGWGTTLAALTGILLIAQLLVTSALAAQALEVLVRSETDLRLEILGGATPQRQKEFFAAVQARPEVAQADYITKERAKELERQRDPDLVAFLDTFKLSNPFPDTISVTLRTLDDYDAFARFVRSDEWRGVVDPGFLSKATDQEARIHELIGLTQAARLLAFVFLGLIGIVLLFVVMELVRRRALMRSEEVFIERLFGAQDTAILLPFIVESMLLLFLSLIITSALLAAFLFVLPTVAPVLAEGGTFAGLRRQMVPLVQTVLPLFVGLEFLLVPVLAAFGAWFGMGQQLRSKRLIVVGI